MRPLSFDLTPEEASPSYPHRAQSLAAAKALPIGLIKEIHSPTPHATIPSWVAGVWIGMTLLLGIFPALMWLDLASYSSRGEGQVSSPTQPSVSAETQAPSPSEALQQRTKREPHAAAGESREAHDPASAALSAADLKNLCEHASQPFVQGLHQANLVLNGHALHNVTDIRQACQSRPGETPVLNITLSTSKP